MIHTAGTAEREALIAGALEGGRLTPSLALWFASQTVSSLRDFLTCGVSYRADLTAFGDVPSDLVGRAVLGGGFAWSEGFFPNGVHARGFLPRLRRPS